MAQLPLPRPKQSDDAAPKPTMARAQTTAPAPQPDAVIRSGFGATALRLGANVRRPWSLKQPERRVSCPLSVP